MGKAVESQLGKQDVGVCEVKELERRSSYPHRHTTTVGRTAIDVILLQILLLLDDSLLLDI